MRDIKNILKMIYRYIKSIIGTIGVYLFSLIIHNKKVNFFNKRFDYVHIVCPGPTAINFDKYTLEENSAVIFINHAVKMCEHTTGAREIFFFSTDPTRVKEVIHQSSKELDSCFSILLPGHFFHIDDLNILKKIDIILLPEISFDLNYGLIANDYGPEAFAKLSNRPKGYGFGSLNASLQIATSFNPKKIIFWGCNFGDVLGNRYFDKDIPTRATEQFDLTKIHFNIIKERIYKMGISLQNETVDTL